MGPSDRVKYTAYAVTGTWSLVILLAGINLPSIVTRILGYLPLAIVFLFWLFDTWFWQVGPIKDWVKRPDLRGTWKGTLTSLQADGGGQEVTQPPIPIFLVIRQSYLSLSIGLLSEQSRSRSIAALVQVNEADDFTIYYHYTNNPKLEFRNQSPIHSGAARLDIAGVAPVSLDGEYWTDRRTRGSFTAQRASTRRYGTYGDASAVLGGGGQ